MIKNKWVNLLQEAFLNVNSCRSWHGMILEDKLEICSLGRESKSRYIKIISRSMNILPNRILFVADMTLCYQTVDTNSLSLTQVLDRLAALWVKYTQVFNHYLLHMFEGSAFWVSKMEQNLIVI